MFKLQLVILVLASIACGSVAALPTAAPTKNINYGEVAALPTLTPFPVTRQLVTTLGKLNVRSCPDTACEVLDSGKAVLEEGVIVEAGKVIESEDIDCHLWLPIQWTSQLGYICQEWTADVE